ncbi:MAG: FAD:protein FMN transferase [Candidatus Omnitrophica bacterium]|nr:FAD:protein FMN transferase [Candidatus Omnitrophota bacterium]
MGTTVEVTIEIGRPKGMRLKGARERASEISKRLFHRLKELETKFSLYNPESEINMVNKVARVKLSPEFFELLEKSLIYSELTSGAFDITIAPLVKLWGFKEHKPRLPKEEDIRDALKRSGYTSIILSANAHEVSFSKPGVEIDMGAIAKGYIVDEGIKFLKKEGIDSALINAGGDLYCIGTPSGKEGWKVAIRHPRKRGKNIAQLTISDKAVATSGDYENFFLYKERFLSHVIDPRTGWPSETGVVSATVISPKNCEADALATALMVMDKKKGLDLINHLDGVEAIIVSLEDGKLNTAVSSGLEGKLKFEL